MAATTAGDGLTTSINNIYSARAEGITIKRDDSIEFYAAAPLGKLGEKRRPVLHGPHFWMLDSVKRTKNRVRNSPFLSYARQKSPLT